jgi:hypothetical protein
MTRGNARELAVHLIYGREFTGDAPLDVIRIRLEEGYYEQLAAEYEIYTERPTVKQVKYLEEIVSGVHQHEEELSAIIGGQQITDHVILAENVFQTTYENGVRVITNYTAQPYESADGMVEAGTWLLVQEGGAL